MCALRQNCNHANQHSSVSSPVSLQGFSIYKVLTGVRGHVARYKEHGLLGRLAGSIGWLGPSSWV